MEIAAAAAQHALLQYTLCAPTDIGTRRGDPGAEPQRNGSAAQILRTTFAVADGRYVQIIAPQLTVHLRFDDLHTMPESKKDTVGHQIIQEEVLHCFDLAKVPFFALASCAWPSRKTSCSSRCTRSSVTAGRSACSATSSSHFTMHTPREKRRP